MNRIRAAVFLCSLAGLASAAIAQDADDWRETKEAVRELLGRELPQGRTADGEATRPETRPVETLAADLRALVIALFESYEREDAGAFLDRTHPSFAARDRSGFDYRRADLPRALADDFEILERIRFEANVGPTTLQRDGARAEAEVRWSRRAWTQLEAREWILFDRRSVFRFERGRGGALLLSGIFGDPIFGLADRTGRIAVAEGTLDGAPVERPLLLDRFVGVVEPAAGSTPEERAPAVSAPAGTAPAGPPPPASTVVAGTFASVTSGFLDFDAQSNAGCAFNPNVDLDFACTFGTIVSRCNGAGIVEITGTFANLEAVTQVPAPPYGPAINLFLGPPDVGRLFAVQTNTGLFAAFEITAFAGGAYTLRFRYQTNGSRNMQ